MMNDSLLGIFRFSVLKPSKSPKKKQIGLDKSSCARYFKCLERIEDFQKIFF